MNDLNCNTCGESVTHDLNAMAFIGTSSGREDCQPTPHAEPTAHAVEGYSSETGQPLDAFDFFCAQ